MNPKLVWWTTGRGQWESALQVSGRDGHHGPPVQPGAILTHTPLRGRAPSLPDPLRRSSALRGLAAGAYSQHDGHHGPPVQPGAVLSSGLDLLRPCMII